MVASTRLTFSSCACLLGCVLLSLLYGETLAATTRTAKDLTPQSVLAPIPS